MPSAATRMDLEGIMLYEISQTKKDKYCKMLIVCKFYQGGISVFLEDCEDGQPALIATPLFHYIPLFQSMLLTQTKNSQHHDLGKVFWL